MAGYAVMTGRCDAAGPCAWMQGRLTDGTVAHYQDGIYLGDFRLGTCPHCTADTRTATLATWPWPRLRPSPIPKAPDA